MEKLFALEQARLDALNRNDVDTIEALMADDLVHVHATGAVQDKAQFLAGLRALPRQCLRENLQIRACGADAAVLTGHVVNTLTRPGQDAPEQIRMMVTLVARRDEGAWRFVSFHACRAPADAN